MIDSFVSAVRTVLDSQVASGVLMLSVLGALWYYLRTLPVKLLGVLQRQFVVTIDVPGNDALFGWLVRWLDEHPYSRRARRLTAATTHGRDMYAPLPAATHGKPEPPRVMFTPAPGYHLLWHKGRPIWLARERKEIPSRDGSWGGYQETLVLRVLGRSADAMRALLDEVRDLANQEERQVAVHVLRYHDWVRVAETKARGLDSVILPDGVMDALIGDAEEFLRSETWYADRGIPWRRGYLFEGPPGTGKSCTIMALAGHLHLDLYVCNVADRGLSDSALTSALLNVPHRSAVLLEDVDAVVSGREVTADNGVTFAGLLNALDGVASKPGTMTFLTTNHVDRLDPALVRAGRVDYRVAFGPPTREQVRRMFLRFYDDATADDADSFAEAFEASSMADVQAFLLKHKDEPVCALRAARSQLMRVS